MFSGTGLDNEAILHTDSRKWPGENRLGKIYKKLSSKYARKLRNCDGMASENQSNIDVFLTKYCLSLSIVFFNISLIFPGASFTFLLISY